MHNSSDLTAYAEKWNHHHHHHYSYQAFVSLVGGIIHGKLHRSTWRGASYVESTSELLGKLMHRREGFVVKMA